MPTLITATAHIDAPSQVVWDRIGDVRHWGDWLPTVTSVTPTDPSRADSVGARYVVVQPKLPKATWEITARQPDSGFTWVSTAPGVAATGTHEITSDSDGRGCDATLAIEWRGFGAGLLRLLYGGLAQRYVDTEAATLKQLSEADAARASSGVDRADAANAADAADAANPPAADA